MKPKRDPGAVLVAIGEVVLKFPDLRVGQIICNALPANYRNDPFYIEDEDLAARIRRLLED